ncbi:MAG: sulfotransferase [Pseudomonadota bacterium]|nr:sulfotransferase [Pseudomonadota bacterium]
MAASPLADPELLPFKLDLVGRQVLWLRLSAAQRRAAAFMDERALPKDAQGGWMSLASLPEPQAATTTTTTPAAAIFHIGHCGSTLLSRLLETWPEVQGLREPLPLRTLAEAWPQLASSQSRLDPQHASALLHALWARWSQTLPPSTRSVVKASSSCNGLISPLLAQVPSLRAILLDMPLRPYLATLLKAPGSVMDAAHAAGERLQWLQSRGLVEGVALHAMSLPQQCAMGWLAERARFDLHDASDSRVLRVDFENLLTAPRATMQAIASHLSLDAGTVDAALSSPAWGRYSKAQDHDYGPADRAKDLALAMERHRAGIDEGVAWVARCLQRYPALQAIAGD